MYKYNKFFKSLSKIYYQLLFTRYCSHFLSLPCFLSLLILIALGEVDLFSAPFGDMAVIVSITLSIPGSAASTLFGVMTRRATLFIFRERSLPTTFLIKGVARFKIASVCCREISSGGFVARFGFMLLRVLAG